MSTRNYAKPSNGLGRRKVRPVFTTTHLERQRRAKAEKVGRETHHDRANARRKTK